MADPPNPFAGWLTATMRARGLSQAEVARAVGVGDPQVSRWRRGQGLPSLRSLQRFADAFAVPRAELERLAGYPVAAPAAEPAAAPALQAELAAYQARHGRVLAQRVPPPLWRAYAEACEALADALAASFADAISDLRGEPAANPVSEAGDPSGRDRPNIGFRS